jgi:hypothetical protein
MRPLAAAAAAHHHHHHHHHHRGAAVLIRRRGRQLAVSGAWARAYSAAPQQPTRAWLAAVRNLLSWRVAARAGAAARHATAAAAQATTAAAAAKGRALLSGAHTARAATATARAQATSNNTHCGVARALWRRVRQRAVDTVMARPRRLAGSALAMVDIARQSTWRGVRYARALVTVLVRACMPACLRSCGPIGGGLQSPARTSGA